MGEADDFGQRLDALARRVLGGGVTALTRLTGGASLELWSFDVGGAGYVLRRAPPSRRFSEMATIPLADEAAVVRAAGAAGVPTATVAHILVPEEGLGSGFVATRMPGEAMGRRIVADAAFAAIRPVLAARCGEVLARLHAVPVASLPPLPARGPAESVDKLRDQLDAFGETRPVFEAALVWLAARSPAPVAPRLVHGDFRTGNYLLTPDGITAVLDWEGAHLGDPAEDMGWLCMPVWRFGRLDRPVGGFGDRQDLFDGYGEPVDAARVRWWEVYGMLRWGLTCMAMAHAFIDGDRGIERGAVGRRASEAELELMLAIAGRAD